MDTNICAHDMNIGEVFSQVFYWILILVPTIPILVSMVPMLVSVIPMLGVLLVDCCNLAVFLMQ